MLSELIGKRFELTEVGLAIGTDNVFVSLTLVSEDEVIRIEPDAVTVYATPDIRDEGAGVPILRASIEPLVDPPSDEIKTDVFGGNFVAAPL